MLLARWGTLRRRVIYTNFNFSMRKYDFTSEKIPVYFPCGSPAEPRGPAQSRRRWGGAGEMALKHWIEK